MKLNRQEKEIVRRKFCAYCIKVLHGEALNYLDELERQRKREVNFSELLQKDLDALYCCDDYDMADLLNNKAVENLAIAAKEVNATLIHISTDYVFQGDKNMPCGEDCETNPLGIYGKTKRAGEQSIQRVGCNYLIFRTAWLYSQFGKNFVKTMRQLTADKDKLRVVFDQIGTPTYAKDLADIIYRVIEGDQYHKQGIYHFSNEGVCSWYDFAKEICELSGNSCDIQPCHSDEFPSKVKRPHFSVLDKTKLKLAFGVEIPYWKDSLVKCINKENN